MPLAGSNTPESQNSSVGHDDRCSAEYNVGVGKAASKCPFSQKRNNLPRITFRWIMNTKSTGRFMDVVWYDLSVTKATNTKDTKIPTFRSCLVLVLKTPFYVPKSELSVKNTHFGKNITT